MDKIPSRRILYVRPAIQAAIITAKKIVESKQAASPRVVDFKDFESVRLWITAHPLFKWSAMCNQLGIDKGNFARLLKHGGIIGQEQLKKIVKILCDYGF